LPEAGSGSVQLLTIDSDLARDLDPRRAREAAQRLYVRALEIPRGRWSPVDTVPQSSRPLGLLLFDGMIVREATVADHPSAELLGPGDVLRSWDDPDHEELLPRSIEWTALTTTRVAVIDHAFAVRAAQWPEVLAALFDRLLALLWSLAERWGRVVPGGVLVSLRLSHRTLAGMVGARRPSVTTALGQLMARGDIERRADGEWILRGLPPEAAPSRQEEPVRFERQVRV
jgi:CRP/FNR family transcriptional regulator, cyclic AMP receptor protein